MQIPAQLNIVLQALIVAGGRPMIVGGAVRDHLMGMIPKDFDVEVYGLSLAQIKAAVCHLGSVCEVGKAFGIVKLRFDGLEYDLSVPRRENKIGAGHKDYSVACDPNMSPKEAAARRDFTMNSVYFDVAAGVIVDPYHGKWAIDNNCLHPTSPAFKEDSLRILRGMQFASRFNLMPSRKCLEYCMEMWYEFQMLPKERIWAEFAKWAMGDYPSKGIMFLIDCMPPCGMFKEISDLGLCQQDKEWHPEGNAYIHTMHVCDEMAAICKRENIVGDQRIVMMFAALCHDFGKVPTTEFIDGRWRSRGHCEAGVPLAENFLVSIGAPNWVVEKVKPLVAEHLTHVREEHTARGVRRLALRLQPANIQELVWLIEADMGGRPPLPKGLPQQAIDMQAMADRLNIQFDTPKPIVMGRHLIEQGMKPGVEMGALLKLLFSAQLNGEFSDLEGGLQAAAALDRMMP